MLKGEAIIELTDVKTGDVEVLRESNLVTNAIPDVINFASAWLFDRTYNVAKYMYPIYNSLLGGVVTFPEAIEENPNKYWAPYSLDPTGFASNVVNSGTETRRGSFNVNESGPVLNDAEEKIGYKYVWDFSTSQGNGSIASVCLTHPQAGYNWYGCNDSNGDGRLKLLATNITISKIVSEDSLWNIPIFTILLNINTGYAYAINFDTGILYRERVIPFNGICLHDTSRFRDVYKSDVLYDEVADFHETNFYIHNKTRYFFSISETEILGVSNAGNSSGNAEVYWIKIDVSTGTYTEGVWTIQATLAVSRCNVAHSNGYIFWVSYDRTSVYKISLENISDVKNILAEFTIDGYDEYWGRNKDVLTAIPSGVILGPGFYISNDMIHQTEKYGSGQGNNGNQYGGVVYGPYLQGYHTAYYDYSTSNGSVRANVSLIPQYLATINNLQSPVVKTADKTMKITYTITETE